METADFRRSASAALDLCYVAAGRVDGFFEYNLKPWDYAAGSLILEEAGFPSCTIPAFSPALRKSTIV